MAKKNTDNTIVDVQEVYTKTELFIEKYKKLLLGILVGIIVLVLAIMMYRSFVVEPRDMAANEDAQMAERFFTMDSVDMAFKGDVNAGWAGLEYLADDLDGTSPGKRVNLQAGFYHRDNGEYDLALEHFKKAEFDSPLLGAMSNAAIGDCLVEIGFKAYTEGDSITQLENYREALPYFEKAATSSEDRVTQQIFSRKAANVCTKLGLHQDAISHYDRILSVASSVTSAEYKDALKLKALSVAKVKTAK